MNRTIHYAIRASSPKAHLYTVSCRIETPDPAGQILSLPSWIPGSYMIRDFAKNVVSLAARCDTAPVAVTRLDKSRWQCDSCDGPLTVEYQVYAWDLSVRSAHLDQTHGYFNGSSVFLEVEGESQTPCIVDIQPPQEAVYGDWRVATGLSPEGAELYGFGTYRAENYDALIDCPVEMADWTLASFEVAGVPHDIVISGRHNADMQRLCEDLTRICSNHVEMFGELPEMQRYTFLVLAVGNGYGGLEHRNSTSLMCSRDDLPPPGMNKANDNYRSFLGLCSHEYFHTWNVKRIKPEVFLPYDLSRETHTRQLWAFEGFTAYYDDLGLIRAGVVEELDYLETLGQTITRVWRGSGRLKQSVADSSFDTWTKFYKQDENAPNAIVSYYTKGSLIAFGLDMILRQDSQGRLSLDDLMRTLWQDYGKPLVGVPEGRIEEIASQLCGRDLSGFFADYLYDVKELPLKDWFQLAGVEIQWRPYSNQNDKGGKPVAESHFPPNFGARYSKAATGITLTTVYDDEPAQRAGLSAQDLVIAVDGLKVEADRWEAMLKRHRPGDRLKVHAFRRDELMEFDVELETAANNVCVLLPASGEQNTKLRQAWLNPTAIDRS